MHQCREYKYRTDDGYRNMPSDDFLPKHEEKTEQQSQGTNLADGSQTEIRVCSQKEMCGIRQLAQHGRVSRLNSSLHDRKRCSTCLCIQIRSKLTGFRPRSHLGRETYQQEATAYKSRIERIVSQPAECHFTDTDGYKSTDKDNPYR